MASRSLEAKRDWVRRWTVIGVVAGCGLNALLLFQSGFQLPSDDQLNNELAGAVGVVLPDAGQRIPATPEVSAASAQIPVATTGAS